MILFEATNVIKYLTCQHVPLRSTKMAAGILYASHSISDLVILLTFPASLMRPIIVLFFQK